MPLGIVITLFFNFAFIALQGYRLGYKHEDFENTIVNIGRTKVVIVVISL